MMQVDKTLYRGTPADFDLLSRWDDWCVVDLRAHRWSRPPRFVPCARIPSWVLQPRMKDIWRFLNLVNSGAFEKYLVVCRRGIDRTGLYVACYRITRGWEPEQAIDEFYKYGGGRFPLQARFIGRFVKEYAKQLKENYIG